MEDYLLANRARSFDLSKPPLMRLALLRAADESFQFVWSFHHLIMDGWSTAIVHNEVMSCYRARCAGRTAELPSARPFRDYIAWIQRQSLADSERFWRERLRGFALPTPLGVDRTPEPGHEEQFAKQELELSESATRAFEAAARHHRVTLNTIFLGAWAIVLSRYSGQRDIVFGASVSLRSPELEGARSSVGLFINTVPIRVQIPSGLGTSHWLGLLQEELIELRRYYTTPLSEVQRWSEIPRGQPLFTSLFVFETSFTDSLRWHAASTGRFNRQWQVEWTNYPLTIIVLPGDRPLLRALFDRERFDSGAIVRACCNTSRPLPDRWSAIRIGGCRSCVW